MDLNTKHANALRTLTRCLGQDTWFDVWRGQAQLYTNELPF